MMLKPKITITNKISNSLLEIERARGFLDAVKLKDDWIKEMQSEALILEAHHSTHIEGTQLTLQQALRILTGKPVKGIRPDDRQELLNYKDAMDFVDGLKVQMLEVKDKGEVTIKRDIIIENVGIYNLNDRQQEILLHLLEKKRASVEEIRQEFNFVRRTIQRDFSKLIDLSLVKEIAKSKTDPMKYYELL